jgi:Flp pilus assembly protein TadD
MRKVAALAAGLAALVLTAALADAQPGGGAGIAVKTTGVAGPGVASASSDSAAARRSEYGIALAMSGELRDAESVFVSLLAASPGAARALTNLGNLRVVNGDLGVALAFYGQALRADPGDPGIVLNRATTLMLMGETEQAEAEAARGIALAGGEAAAARLLGLATAKPRVQRASDKPYVSQQEIRALLRAAAARVPGDSLKPAAADSAKASSRGKSSARTWRSAGPRAGDGGEIASVLYWKK